MGGARQERCSDMSVNYEDLFGPPDLLSECCGARALGELSEGEPPVGICGRCRDWAGFEGSEEEED